MRIRIILVNQDEVIATFYDSYYAARFLQTMIAGCHEEENEDFLVKVDFPSYMEGGSDDSDI